MVYMNSFQFMWTLCDVLVEYLGIGPGDEGVMALVNPSPLLLVSFVQGRNNIPKETHQ